MDPNENLRLQRKIAAAMAARIDKKEENGEFENVSEENDQIADGEQLAELVQALDKWVMQGGFLPDSWQVAQNLSYLRKD